MIKNLSKNRTTTGTDAKAELAGQGLSTGYAIQAIVTGTGAVSATVGIEVSNDGNVWNQLTSMAPSGTNVGSAIYNNTAPYRYIRANTTAVTGSLDVILSI